jgi:Family of unknown function (DUF5706)
MHTGVPGLDQIREVTAMAVPDVEVDREETLEYLRRIYQSGRAWYGIAERKAQLVLAANGILVTVVLGEAFGKLDQLHAIKAALQSDTWIAGALAACAIIGAVLCAGLCMWSLHGKTSTQELLDMGVDIGDENTYCPAALWYFGDLASLDSEIIQEKLQTLGRDSEIQALSYHIVSLARRVKRKHTFVNRAWALTCAALIFTAITAVTIIIHA